MKAIWEDNSDFSLVMSETLYTNATVSRGS